MSRLRYALVSRRVWGDELFRELSEPLPNARDLWLYLLTTIHATRIPGIIVAGPETAAAELRWPLRGFLECWKEIADRGMALSDWRAGVIWLPRAVRHDPPSSPNHVRGYGKAWSDVPDSGLLAEIHSGFGAELSKINASFGQIWEEATSGRRLRKPFARPDESPPLFRSRSRPLPQTPTPSTVAAAPVARVPERAPAHAREEQRPDQNGDSSNGRNGSKSGLNGHAKPTCLADALRMPLADRAAFCVRESHNAEWIEPQHWPEVRAVASALAEALGQPMALATYKSDRGVQAVVALFASGISLEQALAAARAAHSDPWWRKERRGLSSLTVEVVRRSLSAQPGNDMSEADRRAIARAMNDEFTGE